MNVLLIGPYPPPHGGISVHVAEVKEKLERAGMRCCILNLNRNAPANPEFLSYSSDLGFLYILMRHARSGWIFHLHANGHNRKNWLVTLAVGLIGQFASGSVLTIHSGTSHIYLSKEHGLRRAMVRFCCSLYSRIIAVNENLRSLFVDLGVSRDKLEVVPAYFCSSSARSVPELPGELAKLTREAGPILSTSLFFRPEYAFELLLNALAEVRKRYPDLCCLLMGSGEQKAQAERQIQELGLEKTVKLLGDMPHEQCLGVIAASDLFVRANHHDGDSISVREALSLGIRTLASDVGHRPKGAILFRAGDLDDLVLKMCAALALPARPHSIEAADTQSADSYRLLEIYNQFGVRQPVTSAAQT